MSDISPPKRLHECSICGKQGPWTNEWEWFGSYKQIDDGEPVTKICSPACKLEFQSRRRKARIEKNRARDIALRIMGGAA